MAAPHVTPPPVRTALPPVRTATPPKTATPVRAPSPPKAASPPREADQLTPPSRDATLTQPAPPRAPSPPVRRVASPTRAATPVNVVTPARVPSSRFVQLRRPEATIREQHACATKIQAAYRGYTVSCMNYCVFVWVSFVSCRSKGVIHLLVSMSYCGGIIYKANYLPCWK